MIDSRSTVEPALISYSHPFAAFRPALEPYRSWIETTVGVPFADLLIVQTDVPMAHTFLRQELPGVPMRFRTDGAPAAAVQAKQWKTPPGIAPLLTMETVTESRRPGQQQAEWKTKWIDVPVALWFEELEHPFILAYTPYVECEHGFNAANACLLLMRRDSATEVMGLLGRLAATAPQQKSINVINGPEILFRTEHATWDWLVLDPDIARLVRADFECFLERGAWFHENGLPFRRGYLFYGSPGNGKTSVLRVMAAHPKLAATTINLGDENADDSDITRLFDWASEHSPALVFLEDLDRHFSPERMAEHRQHFSLPHLLNCLDGISNPDGVIVVATANEPAALDPAILRRPGRFDRVVHFRPPSCALREEYLRKQLRVNWPEHETARLAQLTEGFSYAQLREAHIVAGQFAFERTGQIEPSDVRSAIVQIGSTFRDVARYRFRRSVGFEGRSEVIEPIKVAE